MTLLSILLATSALAADKNPLERNLNEIGKSIQTATKNVAEEVNGTAKKVDKSVQESSFFTDVSNAAKRVGAEIESGLKKLFK